MINKGIYSHFWNFWNFWNFLANICGMHSNDPNDRASRNLAGLCAQAMGVIDRCQSVDRKRLSVSAKKCELCTANKNGQNACTHKWLEANKLSCPELCQSRGQSEPNRLLLAYRSSRFQFEKLIMRHSTVQWQCSGSFSGTHVLTGQHSMLLLISAH